MPLLRFPLPPHPPPPGTKDLPGFGKVWAVMKGPYGRTLALAWAEGGEAHLVDIAQNNVYWTLPDSVKLWPHDMALGPAAMPLTGAGDRMLALYVAPLCKECGQLEKYVLVPKGFGAPSTEQSTQPVVLPAGQRPPLAHAGSGYHAHGHSHGHGSAAAQQPAAEEHEGANDSSSEGEGSDQAEEAEKQAELRDQQAEEKVEQEAAEEDAQEVKRLHDPQVLQELKQQLAELQAKVNAISGEDSSGAAASSNEAFAVFHTKHRDTEQGSVMGTWVGWVLSMLVGMGAASAIFVAYQKLSGQARQQAAMGQHPVGNGVVYSQGSSCDEEAEVVQLSDTSRLLRR